jgi:hypothetical protein
MIDTWDSPATGHTDMIAAGGLTVHRTECPGQRFLDPAEGQPLAYCTGLNCARTVQ